MSSVIPRARKVVGFRARRVVWTGPGRMDQRWIASDSKHVKAKIAQPEAELSRASARGYFSAEVTVAVLSHFSGCVWRVGASAGDLLDSSASEAKT